MDVARNFNVVECFSNVPEIESWIEFETVDREAADHPHVATTLLERGDFCQVSIGKNHPIDVLNAPIRLISTRWIYEPESKILFSSDMFSHVWHDYEEGPWVLDGLDNVTDEAFVRSFLLNTRYWWIEGATIDSARRNVAKVFEDYDIETLAPGYGTILRGHDQVERQFTVLDNVLRDLDRSKIKPQYVPRGLER
jgi:flavorubredoxin